MAVLFLDLDRFKLINDSLSHAAGDELLKIISERLLGVVTDKDVIARLGGDEFVIILTQIKEVKDINPVIKNILDTIGEPLMLGEHQVSVGASIGIAMYPNDGKSVSELLKNADAAMYLAKRQGGDKFQFYSREISAEINYRFKIEAELREAIKLNQFELVYQPQFVLKENKVVAVEALIRWRHPERGLLLPIDFVPAAEDIGLIVPIGEWVLREACRQNKEWQKAGFPPIRIAVNVTDQQLRQYNFVETVQYILADVGLEPKYLEIEVTENSIVNNQHTISCIQALKQLGVHIALDDFGSGYSTLNHLRILSLDRLKIDRSFVQNILINRGDEAIIQAIIDMAKSFNLEVLAEGVETKKQLNFLKEKKCGEVQGFYFSKPLSVSQVESLFNQDVKVSEFLEE